MGIFFPAAARFILIGEGSGGQCGGSNTKTAAATRLIFPLLTRLFAKMQGKGWRTASTVLTVFMAVDLAVTAAAVARWRSRITDGSPSDSKVIQFLDTAYDDETMSRLFPNMNFCRE